jgi:amidohydrolase
MLTDAEQLLDSLVEWYHDFHMHPELGFKETRTAGRIAEIMGGFGYRLRTGVGKTGVIAEMGQGFPVVAIRADMDALPILEVNSAPHTSTIPGVMHACGHDAHMAIALGVARLLSSSTFPGTIRFLFQPSEEASDDEGISGAPRIIADGAMDSVDWVLALHVDPYTKAGDIALLAGPASGGVDTFYATILGVGGHGAMPHTVVDPIYISGHVILALHGIVSRRIRPLDPAVISIGSIKGGHIDNVIPDLVELSGTIRYMDPQIQSQLHNEINRAVSIAKTMGGEFHLKIEIGYPPMINDPDVIEIFRQVGIKLLGKEHVLSRKLEMGAEDFGFMTALAPGAMFSLGCATHPEEKRLHSPDFDIDERCLPVGVAILAETALHYLRLESAA